MRSFIASITRTMLALAALAWLPAASVAAGAADELTETNPKVHGVIRVQNAVTPGLMKIQDILGTAVGLDEQGQVALIIYVNSEGKNHGELVRALPKRMRGAN